MPLPRSIARLNRRFTNRLLMPVAKRTKGFAIVNHVGRRSGKHYQTPLNYFPDGDDVIIALTYGPDTDWLANIASGPATFEVRGSRRPIEGFEMVERAEAWPVMPAFVRFLLNGISVHDFVRLSLGSEIED